jgi:hypothetical protein
MFSHTTVFAWIFGSALLGACSVNLVDGGAGGKKSSTAAGTATGLPCDLADVINSKCASCHSDPPTAGAPTPLLTVSDLQAPAKTNPSVTMAVQSVTRMQAMSAPMPPAGGATDTDVAAFQNWIDSGYAAGDCNGMSNPDPAFTGMSVCTSNKFWPKTNYGGDETMQPGLACNFCHKTIKPLNPPPQFQAAGTVYPTGHEPDLCYGVNGSKMTDLIVHIVGADGVDHALHPNTTGNFAFKGSLKLPYTAKVVSSKGERVMSEPQTVGDCDLCHTDAAGGNNSTAAGRIVIPY